MVSDRVVRFLGLNGQAILPMILRLGCGTMATMSTHIPETNRERIIATFLFFLDKMKVLGWIEQAASQLVVSFLGLPAKATEMLQMVFLRRDYGAQECSI